MDRIADICSRTVRGAFFLLFGIVPLLLTPVNYELFEYNKMMAVYALTVVIGLSWLIGMIAQKRVRIPKTPLDLPILLFGLSQLVSTLFSMDPHVSWFGYYSRFNGGMLSVVCYIVLYYAFVAHFRVPAPEAPAAIPAARTGKKAKRTVTAAIPAPVVPGFSPKLIGRITGVMLASGALSAGYGIAERLGIDKHLWVQDVQNRVFSTLGQPNWLAAYLIVLIPLAFASGVGTLTRAAGKRIFTPKTVLYGALALLFFVVLIFTRSRSGLIAFAVTDVLAWAALLWQSVDRRRIATWAAAVHAAMLVFVMVNGTYVDGVDRYITVRSWTARLVHTGKPAPLQAPAPAVPAGPSLETGGTESGTIRKYVWEAAIQAWKSSVKTIAVGTGTETFAFAFYQHKPVGHNLTSEWDYLYNKAHNEYLNYLATTGIFGLGSYLLLLSAFIVWFIRTVVLKKEEAAEHGRIIAVALFTGWLSVLITNFFGFSVVVVQLVLFVFPAISYVLVVRETGRNLISLPLPDVMELRVGSSAILAGILIIALFKIAGYWQADRVFAAGYRLDKVGQYAQAYPYLTEAVRDVPGEPLYRDERANALSALSVTAMGNDQATLAGQLAQEALAENEAAIMVSPNNVNYWKTRTKILYALSGLDPGFVSSAITALKHAFTLSPNDPKIAYNLAILYARSGDQSSAIDYFIQAKTLKPDYHDAYKGLYLYYTEIKQPEKAKAVLTDYLTHVDAADIEFTKLLKDK